MGLKIGFTGTSKGMTQHQKDQLKEFISSVDVVSFSHGDCIGADAEAHDILRDLNLLNKVRIHPPKDAKKRPFCEGANTVCPEKAYLDRNHDIVDEGIDLLIAAPGSRNERLRSGTWATVRYARSLNRTVKLLEA